jgi:hypothetical protein
MSDMRSPMGGQPPMGGGAPQMGGAPKPPMSVMNGTDVAYMKSRGDISQDQTIAQYIEGAFGLPVTAPVSALAAKVKEQMSGSTMKGKMNQMGQAPQGGMAPRPAAPPQSPVMPKGPEQSLQGLMSQIK